MANSIKIAFRGKNGGGTKGGFDKAGSRSLSSVSGTFYFLKVNVVQPEPMFMEAISSVRLLMQTWLAVPSLHPEQVTRSLKTAMLPELPTRIAAEGSPAQPPILTLPALTRFAATDPQLPVKLPLLPLPLTNSNIVVCRRSRRGRML